VPDPNPQQTAQEQQTVRAAAEIVTDAMLRAGMDPARAIDHPLVRVIVRQWIEGAWTQDEVIEACEDVLRMYPQLRSGA
jgi:hypothetical protein